MNFLKLASAISQIALYFARMAERRDVESAGAAKVLAAGLQEALNAVSKADETRRAVRADLKLRPDSLRDDDGHRRD